ARLRFQGLLTNFVTKLRNGRPELGDRFLRLRLDQGAFAPPLPAFFSDDLTKRLVQRVRQYIGLCLGMARKVKLDAGIDIGIPASLIVRGLLCLLDLARLPVLLGEAAHMGSPPP